MLAERLQSRCPTRVIEAAAEMPVRPGTIYIAKGGFHLVLAQSSSGIVTRLTQDPPENHCRPAVDVLLRSAVPLYGAAILTVILTGMGSDGLAGCRIVRDHAGVVLVQDQQTSAVWGMPGAVAQAGLANRILPLPQIASEILRIAGYRAGASMPKPSTDGSRPSGKSGKARPPDQAEQSNRTEQSRRTEGGSTYLTRAQREAIELRESAV